MEASRLPQAPWPRDPLSERVVAPEILDSLAPTDPAARRSRRDLRRLNSFLGCSRWILRSVRPHNEAARLGIVELGAGEGELCRRLAEHMPGFPVTGLDLVAHPNPSGFDWRTGNFFETLPGVLGGVAVGSLILHHLHDNELRRLGTILSAFRALIFCEPLRSPWPMRLSRLALPFVGSVTRHDMPVSQRAGFRSGELAPRLGLDSRTWRVAEKESSRGTLRFLAWRE